MRWLSHPGPAEPPPLLARRRFGFGLRFRDRPSDAAERLARRAVHGPMEPAWTERIPVLLKGVPAIPGKHHLLALRSSLVAPSLRLGCPRLVAVSRHVPSIVAGVRHGQPAATIGDPSAVQQPANEPARNLRPELRVNPLFIGGVDVTTPKAIMFPNIFGVGRIEWGGRRRRVRRDRSMLPIVAAGDHDEGTRTPDIRPIEMHEP
jgi:hypothetical protein